MIDTPLPRNLRFVGFEGCSYCEYPDVAFCYASSHAGDWALFIQVQQPPPPPKARVLRVFAAMRIDEKQLSLEG